MPRPPRPEKQGKKTRFDFEKIYAKQTPIKNIPYRKYSFLLYGTMNIDTQTYTSFINGAFS